MDQIATELMKVGSMGALFLAFLIISFSYMVIWARKMLEDQKVSNSELLGQKDRRIDKLELEMFNIQNYIKNELHDIIIDNQNVMNKVLFHLENK
jgi:hypothetical protein